MQIGSILTAMNTEKPKLKKRIFLVNRDFQLRYVRLAVLVGICSTILTTLLIVFPLAQFRIIRFPIFLPPPFLIAILASAVMNTLLVTLLGVHVTHKIAGPMFSMTRQMRQLELNQKFTPVRIRESDDLQHLVRSYNAMIAQLRQCTEADVQTLQEVKSLLQEQSINSPAALALVLGLQEKLMRRL